MTNSGTMMDLSCSKPRDSNLDVREENTNSNPSVALDCKPKDLTVKTNMRRSKPIPPPLILKSEIHPETSIGISTALKEFAILATGPHSPLMQKNLPFRKRAHSVPEAIDAGPFSAPPTMLRFFPNIFFKQEKSPDEEKDSSPPLNLSLPPTPKGQSGRDTESPLGPSASVSSTNSELTSQHVSSSSHPSSPRPGLSSGGADPQHINTAHQSFARHHLPPWSPYLPTPGVMASHWLNGPPSALLSPAPSSLGSSQEDLRHPATHSVPLSSVSNLVYESDPWRLPWPYPVWHCFQLGTLVRFSINSTDIVLRAEEIAHCNELQFLTPERIGSLSVQCIKPLDTPNGVAEISFSSSHGMSSDIKIFATCYSYHTFLVMEKGWCAVSPESVLRQYGIQCQPLECGDCCALPPKMPSVSSPGICEKFKRFSFSPEELGSSIPPSPGSLILSPPNTPTMKTQQTQPHTQQQSRQAAPSQSRSKSTKQKSQSGQRPSEKSSKTSKAPLDPDRPKRPMNAFMLFAKQHRLKLIRMHPGRDNRYVSVILGEAWRQLPADQKEVFITEAKALSHERKRLHPECWKRKRSQSTS